jgi:response regulator RpfG family c-di-GMP phosphodiesterase
MKNAALLLYVSAHPQNLIAFQSQFGQFFQIRTASNAQEAMETILREDIMLVLTEQTLTDMQGVQLLANVSVQKPDVLRAIVTENTDGSVLHQAINQAHVHCSVVSPFVTADVNKTLEKAFLSLTKSEQEPANHTPQPKSVEDLQAQLTKAKIDLSAVMQELKTTQYQLIISEKMAALGQLVANVGHEINTPVSAMKSSATTMDKLLPAFIKDLPTILMKLPKEHAELFYQFMLAAASNEASLSAREERQYRKELEEQFMGAGIGDAAELAKTLVEMQMVSDSFSSPKGLLSSTA